MLDENGSEKSGERGDTMECQTNLEEITISTSLALRELLAEAKLKPGQVLVVGCTTSEIIGGAIGTCGNEQVGRAVYQALAEILTAEGVYLAVQCCEHLNRGLVMERDCAEKYGWEIVNVIPQLNAGGALATVTYHRLKDPVVVETVCCHAGMDIGGTLIGMHLRPVAVPIRGTVQNIGQARLTMARTRPRMVGGDRAIYRTDL